MVGLTVVHGSFWVYFRDDFSQSRDADPELSEKYFQLIKKALLEIDSYTAKYSKNHRFRDSYLCWVVFCSDWTERLNWNIN